ncbi:hypothetical protein LSM04_001993 [Trypanosoma melophagium]|uniref:uncharacterized protein n=1 Tax=Trypanosoma melophagium TaxID=715481 RepID=UPI00351A0154|nr:hypothetical protein LSM04_001993 [Trypanosoma melophagium]
MTVQDATTTGTTVGGGGGDINQKNKNSNHEDNDTNNDFDDVNNSKDDIVTHVKTSTIFSIPIDIIREILSFLPAYCLLHTVIRVSSYLKGIIQNDSYWQNLWTTRQITCFSHYVQLAKQSEVGGRYIPITLSTLSRDHSILLASVVPSKVPNISFLEHNNSLIRLSNGYDSNGNSVVTHISIASSPLLLLSTSEDADSLTQLLSHLAGTGVETKRQKTQKPESGTQRVISLRRKCRNESIRLSKALCFLENSKSLGSSRPIIDDFHTLRLFLFSHDLPPQLSRRDGTPEEHEAALYEFMNALVYAWKCCHPAHQFISTTRMGLPIQQMEGNSTFMIPSEGREEEEERETEETRLGITAVAVITPPTRTMTYNDNGEEEKEDDGVFFSVSEYLSMPVSSTLMTSSRLIVMPGTSSVRRLRFSLSDTLIYLFLLEHVTFSDIHQHVWNDERKNAICSRILSPTGHAVELRFFTSSLISVYPRFFVKMEFTQADLPRTRIQKVFEQQRIHPSGPFSSSSSSSLVSDEDEEDNNSHNSHHHGNHNNATLASLFFGGYGRVEVDIPPTVAWDNFVRLRSALGLDESFPMQLLWNVVVFAAGAGGDILQQQKSSFVEYYQTSFTAAFTKGFPSTAEPSV